MIQAVSGSETELSGLGNQVPWQLRWKSLYHEPGDLGSCLGSTARSHPLSLSLTQSHLCQPIPDPNPKLVRSTRRNLRQDHQPVSLIEKTLNLPSQGQGGGLAGKGT